MQKYEETHKFVISREFERKKKKQYKNAAIGGVKVQKMAGQKWKQLVNQ